MAIPCTVKYLTILAVVISRCYGHGDHGHEKTSDNVGAPDKEHIKEHLKEEAEMDTSKMSQEELEFYHFKLHDTDNNTALDGLEVYKAILHQTMEHAREEKEVPKTHEELMASATKREEETCKTVDSFMLSVDKNTDGFISFVEYKIHMSQFNKPQAAKTENL